MPRNKKNLTGLILAGGQSTRMQGNDKGLIQLKGAPLIEHVIERLQPQVDTLVISCNRNLSSYQQFGYRLARDNIEEQSFVFNGPLAGILSGLACINSDFALIVPCDNPDLPTQLASRLFHELIHSRTDIAVPHDGQRIQPLYLLLKTRLLPQLSHFYAQGGRSVIKWLGTQEIAEVDFSAQNDCFNNINTPDDLVAFEKKQAP
jgi:molybdenum cofactor guanylyltransferase